MTAVGPEAVSAVRSFNRFYTKVIGLLSEGLLQTPYSLTEARVIFELAKEDATEVVALRRELGLDAGYVSRVLSRLETEGLVRRSRSQVDARRQTARLTPQGRKAFRKLDRRSAAEVGRLLKQLSNEEQARLMAAMTNIRRMLEGSPRPFAYVLRPPRAGDFGWVVSRHGVLYAEEYGWDHSFEALVARIVADYVDHRDIMREEAWIAELDGEPVGCVFCVTKDDSTAQLRLMLVEPRARGMGIGTRLCQECIRFARSVGYEQIMLWTNDVLVDARRIYQRLGFRLGEEGPHHSFGHDLVGQNWWLKL
jgi:DNA-binding MarR family transcriptional regulator/N-acetylglutamate synthase-like GNAT family acetyltransferase